MKDTSRYGPRMPGGYAINSPLSKLFSSSLHHQPSSPTITGAAGKESAALIGSATWSATNVVETPGQTRTQTNTYTQPVLLSLSDPVHPAQPEKSRALPSMPTPGSTPLAGAIASEPELADRQSGAAPWLQEVQKRLERLASKAAKAGAAAEPAPLLDNARFRRQVEKLLTTTERHYRKIANAAPLSPAALPARPAHEVADFKDFFQARKAEVTQALLRNFANDLALLLPYAGHLPTLAGQTGGAPRPAAPTPAEKPATGENRTEQKRKRDLHAESGTSVSRKRLRPATTPVSGATPSKDKTDAATPAPLSPARTPQGLSQAPKANTPMPTWSKALSPSAATLQESVQAMMQLPAEPPPASPSAEHAWIPKSPRSKVYERERSERLQNSNLAARAAAESPAARHDPTLLPDLPDHGGPAPGAREHKSSRTGASDKKRKHEDGAGASAERQVKRARRNAPGGAESQGKTVAASPFSGQRRRDTMNRGKHKDQDPAQ